LIAVDALGAEGGLLAGLVAADVDAIDQDARGLVEDGPGITSGRDLFELDLGDGGSLLELALVEQAYSKTSPIKKSKQKKLKWKCQPRKNILRCSIKKLCAESRN
jgi:hypothetical protein